MCDQLIGLETDVVDQLKSLRAQVEGHRLDPALEKSMQDMKHRVEEQVSLRDNAKQNGGQSCYEEGEKTKGRMVSDEEFELYLKLVDGLNEIKNA